MSRCFPFPPPGYEKKTTLDDTDLLTKEKHKERRHKKDKEKREGTKRKKDKERSEGQPKEKKERKEKHKDRNDKDREKKSKLAETDIVRPLEGQNGEKHGSKCPQSSVTMDSKFLLELGKRIKDEGGARENQMFQDRNDKDREKKSNLAETDIVRPLEGQNGEKHGSKCPQSSGTMDSKFLLELGKRIKDGGGARENQMFQSVTVTYQKSGELPGRVVEINIAKSTEAKETYKNKKDSDRNINGQSNQVEARGVENGFLQGFNVENGVVQGFGRTDQKRDGGVAGTADKDVKTQMEGKKKHKHKDGERQKSRDKPDYKDRTKETEKEAKAKEKEPNKKQPTLQESNKDGIDSRDLKPPHLLKDGNKSSTYHINLGKRKEPEMNGFSHDDGIRLNKLLRLISSSHQLVQNGRKLELCQSALQLACERQAAASNDHKVEVKISSSPQILQNGRKLEPKPTAISNKMNKDATTHGLIEAQRPNASSSKPLSTAQAKERVKASVKLPHPDSKYLSEILAVPKVAKWSDFDNQEWLFSSNNLDTEKPNVPPIEVDGTPQVWAQALRIESMDVTALPYVIPF